MTLKAYDTLTGDEIQPGDTIRSRAAGLEYTFREPIRATTATRDGSIEVDAMPGRVRYHAGLFGLHVSAVDEPAVTLRAYREDGTELQPGDLINMGGNGNPFPFLAATAVSNDAGLSGVIAIEGYPDMFASPFGLTVRAVPAVAGEPAWESAGTGEPAWESAGTGEPGDIQRDIRGPGGFWALIGPDSCSRQDWSIIDYSDGETVASGKADDQEAARQAVLDWEARVPLLPDVTPPPAVHDLPSDRSEPVPAEPVRDLRTILADLDAADHRTAKARNLSRELEDAVRAQLRADLKQTAAMAAEADHAARTTAPPVPGVTMNTGHTVYAVLPSALPGRWWVAMKGDREHVTWDAETCPDGTLAYNTGHYHTSGEGAGDEALADLAHRAGIFSMLTNLSSGVASRQAFQDSHASVMTELAEVHGVGRARVRSGLLEAAALGYARISWTTDGTRKDYGIRYDRYRCIFTWNREH